MENTNNIDNTTSENTSVNVCCFHRYNKTDDLTKVFETINDFRTKYGLKFTHHKFYIYMIVKSDYLKELSEVLPFQISKFRTESHYKCSSEDVQLLTSVKNSFIRTSHDESTDTVIFRSKTNMAVHLSLIHKIFESLKLNFDNDSHTVLNVEQYETKNANRSYKKNSSKIEIEDEPKTPRNKTKYNKKSVKKTAPVLSN
jgi:hypothetical protein